MHVSGMNMAKEELLEQVSIVSETVSRLIQPIHLPTTSRRLNRLLSSGSFIRTPSSPGYSLISLLQQQNNLAGGAE